MHVNAYIYAYICVYADIFAFVHICIPILNDLLLSGLVVCLNMLHV